MKKLFNAIRGRFKGEDWQPSVTIWHVQVIDEDDGYPMQDLYFLSYKRAQRFFDKNMGKVHDMGCKLSLGGEQLWLW